MKRVQERFTHKWVLPRALFALWILLSLLAPSIVRATITMIPGSDGFSSYPAYDGSDPWHQETEGVYVGGTVTVDGGSDVYAGATNFGVSPAGGTATLTITGAGSTWTDMSNGSPSLTGGGYGIASFNVLNGGSLSTTGAWWRSQWEYYDPSKVGHVSMTIAGTGSNWTARGGDVWLEADPNGADIALRVLDGGQFVQARNLVVGYGYEGGPALCEVRGAGSRIILTSSLSVSISRDQGLRVLEGGAVDSVLGFVAQYGNDVALAIVDGPGSRWSMTNDLMVGRDGDGEIRALNGATLASRRGILGQRTNSTGFNEPSMGTATISGTNSNWTLTQTLTVGSNDRGALMVDGGGKVTANALDLATTTTSYATGSMAIDGNGSLVQVAGTLRVGVNNQGDVTLNNGGDMSSGTGIINRGLVIVTGAGSTWTGGGKTVNALGSLRVNDGGQVAITAGNQLLNLGLVTGDGTISGTFRNQGIVQPGNSLGSLKLGGSFQQDATGTLDLEIGSAGNDLLDIAGTAVVAGTLRASTLAGGFSPVEFHAGDRFDVVQATAGVTGTFGTTVLPALPSNLSWKVDYSTTKVSLLVIPEPRSLSLIIMSGAFLAARRRARVM